MRRLGIIFGSIVAIMLVIGVVWAVLSGSDADPPPAGSTTTASSTPRPAQISVRASSYVGMPVAKAARELRRLGFEVTARVRVNHGAGVAGAVAGVAPTGRLDPGARVVLSAWGPAVAHPPQSTSGGGQGAAGTGPQPPHPGGKPAHHKGGKGGKGGKPAHHHGKGGGHEKHGGHGKHGKR
jgi:hypothetical protein